MPRYRVVGRRLPRVDAEEKVKGSAIYCTDLRVPGMLYGKALRSELAHAKILNIDTAKARRLPGVKAIVTGRDIPYRQGLIIRDEPFIARERIRYCGEAVAAVAAIDEEVAQEALDLIEVDYEELPAIFDPVEAMNQDSLLIHEDLHTYQHDKGHVPIKGTNICYHYKLRRGDIEKGFEKSDIVFEDTFSSHMVQHACLEPHAAISCHDSSNRIIVWTSNDGPYRVLTEIAESMDIPFTKVRVIGTYQGGGFGSKGGLRAEAIAVALALKTKHRPVKVVFTREEEFTSGLVRHPATISLKTGVKKNGIILARQVRLIWDTGAYAEKGPWVTRNASMSSTGPYEILNISVDGYCVYTNKPISGAFRGFGIPQVSWAHESQMDIIAHKLQMDPLEIRLANAFEEGSISGWGETLHSIGLKECLRRVADTMGWGESRPQKNRGRGIACMYKCTSAPSSSTSFVKINQDGTVGITTCTMEIGQGSRTVLSQIAAEELGVPLEAISISMPDTDYNTYDVSTTGSRSTFHMGNAVKMAAAKAKTKLFSMASELIEANPQDLDCKDGQVFVRGVPSINLSISEVIKRYYGGGGSIMATGCFHTKEGVRPDQETGQSPRPAAFWMYGAQAAEVEVDSETGEISVLKIAAAHDVGKAINPGNCEGQIEGALTMGVGTTLTERMILEKGKVLNANFHDYRIPTALDTPHLIPIIVEAPHLEGPFGAKGLGEPAMAPTAPAIANAVFDAIGIRIKDLPLTPEKIFFAIKKGGETSKDHENS